MAGSGAHIFQRGHSHVHRHLHRRGENAFPLHQDGAEESSVFKLDVHQPSTPSVAQPPTHVELARRDTTTCTDTSSPGCKTGGSAPPALAIGLGVAIPLGLAIVVFIWLHRRHVKKLRQEDSNDPHKSLDFGVDAPAPQKGQKKGQKKGKKGDQPGQEMTVADGNFAKSLRGGRGGLSMDMGSPYLLPPEIHNSRESLHSLSRTVTHGSHDPYRSMHNHAPGEGSSLRSFHMAEDNASTHTASTRHGHRQDGMNQNLLRNAQRMSQSDMPSVHSPNSQGDSRTTSPPGQAISPPPAHAISPPSSYSIPRKQLSVPNDEAKLAPPGGPEAKGDIRSSDLNALRKSNNYLGAFIHSREASIDRTSGGTSQPDDPAPKPDYGMGGPLTLPSISIDQDPNGMDPEPYDVNDLVVPAIEESLESPPDLIPDATPRTETSAFYTPAETPTEGGLAGLGVSNSGLNSRPLSIVRPLPPEDPNDNAEQRANRIRSFYKEYFDDNAPARAYKVGSADYYEDYGQEYLSDGAIFDPATGKFIVANAPYAEPVTRRAMTPPPRGPPRFQGGGAPRHGPKMSGPLPRGPRSRAFSSASTSHMGPGPGPGHQQRGPRRPRQPPAPLRTLPTPHLITEDAFALPIDFAPPSNFRDQQAGRPQSPFGEFRPYSPSVPAANPLASSYSELSAMPSPHQLRKSSTFTALDFAPPPKFRGADGAASDAGSIRSGRSNGSALSAAQQHSLRAGAHRVSRIPKELVGTHDEFAQALKPSWKVGS